MSLVNEGQSRFKGFALWWFYRADEYFAVFDAYLVSYGYVMAERKMIQ